jgi:hypothetical protein
LVSRFFLSDNIDRGRDASEDQVLLPVANVTTAVDTQPIDYFEVDAEGATE